MIYNDMKNKPWTNIEIDLLKNNYINTNYDELLTMFPGRSVSAIAHKVQRIGLKRSRISSSSIDWAQNEIELLKEAYSTTDSVSNLFPNRTYQAIRAQASKLGLKRDRIFSQLSKKTISVPIKLEKLGYIAGLIDGEGSIITLRPKNPNHNLSFHVLITNTHFGVMEWLIKNVGGTIQSRYPRPRPHVLAKKICYTWYCTGRSNILHLLKAILPYLIIKKEKATQVINEINRIGNNV